MGNLMSQAEKDAYSAPFNDIHDTFSDKIIFYKEPDKIILSTNVDYNPYYENISEESVSYVQKSGIISGRILYNKTLDKDYSTPIGGEETSFRYIAPDGFVRIKIRKEDYPIFEDAIDIRFDGYTFENYKTPRPHGLFNRNFYTLFLKIKK